MINSNFVTTASSNSSSSGTAGGALVVEPANTATDTVICHGHVFSKVLGANSFMDFILACKLGIANQIWPATGITTKYTEGVGIELIVQNGALNKYTYMNIPYSIDYDGRFAILVQSCPTSLIFGLAKEITKNEQNGIYQPSYSTFYHTMFFGTKTTDDYNYATLLAENGKIISKPSPNIVQK